MRALRIIHVAFQAALISGVLSASSVFAQVTQPETAQVAPQAPAAPTVSQPTGVQQPALIVPQPGEMQPAPVESAPVVSQGAEPAPSTLPHDLSPWGMFMAADWVVKAVMIGLAIASLITWTVWLAKSLELAGAKRRIVRALDRIVQSRSLDEAAVALDKSGGPATLLVRAARHEMQVSAPMLDHGGSSGLKERVTSHLSRIEAQAARRMTRGTGALATIGSTAPFVGLFGTVWGIMNSFIGISEAQTTNLAIVAPGIAEALLATAIGLVAAIPAVVIYNMFARSISGYKLMLGDASAAVERLVSRDIDRRALPVADKAAARAAE